MPSRTSSADGRDPVGRPRTPVSSDARRSRPRSHRPSSRSARRDRTPSGASRWSRCRCCPGEDGGGRCSGPAPTRSRSCSASTCSRVLEAERGHRARPARSPRCRCRWAPRTTPTCARSCWSASAPAGAEDFRRAGAALARADPRPGRGRDLDPRDRAGRRRSSRSSSARCSARSPSTGARARPSTSRSPGSCSPALPDDDRARAGPRGRRRRRRLALADARHGALQPQEPRLAGRAGRRARRRGTASRCTVWDEKRARRRGLRRHRRRRPGLGDAAAADPARLHAARGRRRGVRRPSCWSARASPSTPAVSRSSPARRWST